MCAFILRLVNISPVCVFLLWKSAFPSRTRMCIWLEYIHAALQFFPGWDAFSRHLEARSLPRYLPYKVEGPAARRMQAADPFAIDTVSSGPSLPRCPSGGFTALAASIRRRSRCRNCHRNRRRCKHYSGDELIQDFVPCLNADGVPCMYDLIRRRTFYNKGTGSFTWG